MNTRRRLFMAFGACAVPGTVFAQAKKPPVVIGWLNSQSRPRSGGNIAVFKEAMGTLGWKEGANCVLEMVVNQKTAKALGLTIPPEIMVQVTRVIQ